MLGLLTTANAFSMDQGAPLPPPQMQGNNNNNQPAVQPILNGYNGQNFTEMEEKTTTTTTTTTNPKIEQPKKKISWVRVGIIAGAVVAVVVIIVLAVKASKKGKPAVTAA